MSERSIALKRRLRAGETVIGAWLTIADPAVAEIMATADFDFVLVDAEHAPWTTALLQMVLMAFKGEVPVPIVRVPWNDPVHIKQMLDVGAEGILAPMVRSVGEARALIRACRYPPEGERGFGPVQMKASSSFRRSRMCAPLTRSRASSISASMPSA
jgi:2-keto-3-deoxy-L-rhamnonate aldolase RhmA